MAASEVLLKVLNNTQEPPEKRLKLADNALSYPELQFHHKEPLLLKWVLNNSEAHISMEESAKVLKKWLVSREIQDLTQNDISNDDIGEIIQLLKDKLLQTKPSKFNQLSIIDSILLLCDIKVFQNYFTYHIETYCVLLSLCLEAISDSHKFVDTLKRHLFRKELLVQDGFVKQFLNVLCPVFVDKVIEFKGDEQVFEEAAVVVQKCIFQGHTKEFQSFFNAALGLENEEDCTTGLPKQLFKFLSAKFQEEPLRAATVSKLIFSAFIETFKESHWAFYYLVYLNNLLKIDQSKDFTVSTIQKQKRQVLLSNALEITCVVLEKIASKNFVESKISSTSFTEYLTNFLKLIMSLNILNSTVFKIIQACIQINPLTIETIATTLVVYLIGRYSEELKTPYEATINLVLGVFSKLHRLENFIAKIIPAIKNLGGDLAVESNYSFNGEQDLEVAVVKLVSASSVLSSGILDYFAKCLNGLASWQTINMLKTLLFHLREAVLGISKGHSIDPNQIFHLEFLQKLITTLLMNVKIADNNLPQNVIEKFVKGLKDLREILNELGSGLLKREHNHVTMRAFLDLAYVWAEINITLNYYSDSREFEVSTVDGSPTAANLTYLHSYMDVNDWKMVTQRISNFGEAPCKICLQKLYFQKLRAMLLFEKHIQEDTITNIIKNLQSNLEHTWQDLISDRFAVSYVVPKLDKVSLTVLAEKLVENDSLVTQKDSVTLINAAIYTLLGKINKLFRMKRKHDAVEKNKCLSSKIFAYCPEEIFFSAESFDISEVVENIQNLYENDDLRDNPNVQSKEDKLQQYLMALRQFPVIYSEVNVQKVVLLYLVALCTEIGTCSDGTRNVLEDIVIGMLQSCKFPLSDIFKLDTLCSQILSSFNQHETTISLVIDNVFKRENSIMEFEPFVEYLTSNMDDPKCMSCSISVLQAVNRIKKSKMDGTAKAQSNQYKEKILEKMLKLVCKSDSLVEPYATCLRHFISLSDSEDKLQKLLNKLDSYLDYCLNKNPDGSASLFTVVLQNKSKIKNIDSDVVLKIWNSCKVMGINEENAGLLKLVVTLIPNEQFEQLVGDLFNLTNQSITEQHHLILSKQLKTWESILICDVNPVKMKIWQDVLEKLIFELIRILKTSEYQPELFKNIVNLILSIIQAHRFIISPPLIDMFILTPSILMHHDQQNFDQVFPQSISILESLLKYRNAIIMDRLPAFLQQYRVLLKSITSKSNSDADVSLDVKKASDCVHNFEKLTKNLVGCKKDMGRIAVFLIADILERYEKINLYPNVKLHLNNCIYSLISLCDHHAVSYLMRVLSEASTEMFKIMYAHYKKYYMFTGKV